MLKRGQSAIMDAPEPDMNVPIIDPPDLPISSEKLRQYLLTALASNYKDKFGTRHIPQKNVFSVSSLVSGPGTAASTYRKTLEKTNEKGEEAKMFNMGMFRGSAIHDYATQRLEKFYAYEKIDVREEFPYQWKDSAFSTIVIMGHPDLVHYGRLALGDMVFCDDPSAGVVLEVKTISSNLDDMKELYQYKNTVLKKAKRQVGCYATMLSNELKRKHYSYVVTFDDRPNSHFLTQEDKDAKFVMINGGTTRLELDEKMIKRGAVFDSGLRVWSMTQEEQLHGYSYCKWAAQEAARIIEEGQK